MEKEGKETVYRTGLWRSTDIGFTGQRLKISYYKYIQRIKRNYILKKSMKMIFHQKRILIKW